MSLVRPRQIRVMYGLSVWMWQHAQKTMDLQVVHLHKGGKPFYDEAEIRRKFGVPLAERGVGKVEIRKE